MQKPLVIDNTDGLFLKQMEITLYTLRATYDILEDMHNTMCKSEPDRTIREQSSAELYSHMELINYWELVLKDNGIEL